MEEKEIIQLLVGAITKSDRALVYELLDTYRESEPIKNFRYFEAIFWLKNGDINRARTALYNEILDFPDNVQAAKVFMLIQPASRNLFKNPELDRLFQSIDFIHDHPNT